MAIGSLALLGRVLAELRRLDVDMSVCDAASLVEIARSDGALQADLQERLGLTKNQVSRIAIRLSSTVRDGRARGLGLVDVREDLTDRRQRVLTLSSQGKQVVVHLLRIMDG